MGSIRSGRLTWNASRERSTSKGWRFEDYGYRRWHRIDNSLRISHLRASNYAITP